MDESPLTNANAAYVSGLFEQSIFKISMICEVIEPMKWREVEYV